RSDPSRGRQCRPRRRRGRDRAGAAMSAPATGIQGISYALPARRRTLSELETLGLLESDPTLLEEFGFSHVYVAEEETPYSIALAAATALLNEYNVSPSSVDALLYCGTPSVAFARGGSA